MTKRATPITNRTTPLLPMAVDVDLVRFEKNLLQMGFFGANDARDKNRTSRRIEQVVFRNGHKVKVAAEFRGSEQLGLPSTTDRDKFIALLKIISEERAETGQIANPIRFSGYRMIQELGLSRNGEIYEEIVRWGKRMTDTTITSEKVVYRAAKKVYSDEVLHVFRSFKRTGSSNLNGTEKQEHFEVTLEDWLIENLNQRYVIPEDFNAYKQLTRPTAKGIFGNLHLWFHASQGRQVEKDYSELCNLLNVQAYPHLSKIKSTMGLALNELVKIRYISKWDVQPMSSKDGYKLVLTPGAELLRVLQNTRPEQRELPASETLALPSSLQEDEAADLLLRHGVLPAKARSLVERYGPELVTDTVEYLESQMSTRKRGSVENPAGLIIYSLENNLPVGAGFISSRRRAEQREIAERDRAKEDELRSLEMAYFRWIDGQRQEALETLYPGAKLDQKLDEVIKTNSRTDPFFRRVGASQHRGLALQIVSKEIRDALVLPSFEAWKLKSDQIDLFRQA
jgi:plasmid replication initiation protein